MQGRALCYGERAAPGPEVVSARPNVPIAFQGTFLLEKLEHFPEASVTNVKYNFLLFLLLAPRSGLRRLPGRQGQLRTGRPFQLRNLLIPDAFTVITDGPYKANCKFVIKHVCVHQLSFRPLSTMGCPFRFHLKIETLCCKTE